MNNATNVTVNVPKNTNEEHPGFEDEAIEVGEANFASREEEFIISSEDETEGSPECDPMGLTDRDTRWKEKKKKRKQQARTKKRRERRGDKKRLQEALHSVPMTTSEALFSTSASTEFQSGTSIPQDNTQLVQIPTKLRGRLARLKWREDKREAKRQQLFDLSTAPAAVREREQGAPNGQPGTSTQTGYGRDKTDKAMPPEGQKKVRRARAVSRQRTHNRENQVVILSNREDSTITPAEIERLRENLVSEMYQTMVGPEGGPRGPELRFRKSGMVHPGWFLVTAQDETSMEWLLEGWKPLTEGDVTFQAIRAYDAPWSERIGFWLRSAEVDLSRVRMVLYLQNRSLDVKRWRHLKTTGRPGGWHLTFMIGQDTSRRLEEAGWVLYYELITLTVRRMPAWSEADCQASRALGGPGPSAKGK